VTRRTSRDRNRRGRALVPRPLLTNGEGRRVLKMGAADLHDVGPLLCLLVDGIAQTLERRQRFLRLPFLYAAMCIAGREGVVARLTHVDVVIGMDRRLRTQRPSDQLDAAVRDDFVEVHVLNWVARNPSAKHRAGNSLIECSAGDFVADFLDKFRPSTSGKTACRGVHDGGRFFFFT